jgi:hypothetical protein
MPEQVTWPCSDGLRWTRVDPDILLKAEGRRFTTVAVPGPLLASAVGGTAELRKAPR